MFEYINISKVLPHLAQYCIVDVRSPGEFHAGHIPGAFSVPLFENSERAVIGTLYKQEGQEAAVERGLEIVGPKLLRLVKAVQSINDKRPLIIHCWRGGMRSESMAWLLKTTGMKGFVLEGGYKAYRAHLYDFWTQPKSLYVLSGYTGSGKTELLAALKEIGEQVVDLEHLARHKGSAFGGLGQGDQPTAEQFQNDLFHAMIPMDPSRAIWMEDESINMGQAFIPELLFYQMRKAPLVVAHLSHQERVNRLVKEYGHFSQEELKKSVDRISRRLGGLRYQEAMEDLESGQLDRVVSNVLIYYDRAYLGNIEKRRGHVVFEKVYESFSPDDFIEDLKSQQLI